MGSQSDRDEARRRWIRRALIYYFGWVMWLGVALVVIGAVWWIIRKRGG